MLDISWTCQHTYSGTTHTHTPKTNGEQGVILVRGYCFPIHWQCVNEKHALAKSLSNTMMWLKRLQHAQNSYGLRNISDSHSNGSLAQMEQVTGKNEAFPPKLYLKGIEIEIEFKILLQ